MAHGKIENLSVRLRSFLDRVAVQIAESPTDRIAALKELVLYLRDVWREASPGEWSELVTVARRHVIRELLSQDPLTHRSFSQPRGYQGDAELLDLIYSRDPASVGIQNVSAIGRAIFSFTVEGKAPAAVRTRRSTLIQRINRLAEERHHPDVFSLACGHMRELQGTRAMREGKLGKVLGVDQDPISVALVNRELGSYGVEAVKGSLAAVFAGSIAKRQFDFVYSTGLFDYLDNQVCARLVEALFKMVKPGGRMLVANYLPDIEDIGYMEAYMDWRLIYRSRKQLESLGDRLPVSEMSTMNISSDSGNQVAYLEIVKSE